VQTTEVNVERWVALVIVSLRVILTQSKEEAVLGRLQQLGLGLCLADSLPSSDRDIPVGFLLKADVRASSIPEEVFARYILVCHFPSHQFCTLKLMSSACPVLVS